MALMDRLIVIDGDRQGDRTEGFHAFDEFFP